jgi:hypothetical protein
MYKTGNDTDAHEDFQTVIPTFSTDCHTGLHAWGLFIPIVNPEYTPKAMIVAHLESANPSL